MEQTPDTLPWDALYRSASEARKLLVRAKDVLSPYSTLRSDIIRHLLEDPTAVRAKSTQKGRP